ncbi:hypothetical protein AOG2_22790 [Geobacter sp. AOG2]|nr:hypothetical protein AOG2_22790 [Geobacter sp. AOG2]
MKKQTLNLTRKSLPDSNKLIGKIGRHLMPIAIFTLILRCAPVMPLRLVLRQISEVTVQVDRLATAAALSQFFHEAGHFYNSSVSSNCKEA